MTRPGGSKRIWSLHTAEVNGTVLRVTHLEDKMTEGDPATSSLPFIHRELGICKGPQKPSTNVFHVKHHWSSSGVATLITPRVAGLRKMEKDLREEVQYVLDEGMLPKVTQPDKYKSNVVNEWSSHATRTEKYRVTSHLETREACVLEGEDRGKCNIRKTWIVAPTWDRTSDMNHIGSDARLCLRKPIELRNFLMEHTRFKRRRTPEPSACVYYTAKDTRNAAKNRRLRPAEIVPPLAVQQGHPGPGLPWSRITGLRLQSARANLITRTIGGGIFQRTLHQYLPGYLHMIEGGWSRSRITKATLSILLSNLHQFLKAGKYEFTIRTFNGGILDLSLFSQPTPSIGYFPVFSYLKSSDETTHASPPAFRDRQTKHSNVPFRTKTDNINAASVPTA
ncbi:hypothetical protein EDD17DRAFT_1893388 [Pisolithus thermaeus]|nr:hypothetical protein EDD17DRAFT_1893388 [Pisolithus thermaeus]